MKKLAFILWLLVMLVPATALGNPDAVDGRWNVIAFKDGTKRKNMPKGTAMELVFDKAERLWTAVVTHQGKKHRASGSWKMDRNIITMTHKGRKSELIATSSANTLILGMKKNPSRRFVALRIKK